MKTVMVEISLYTSWHPSHGLQDSKIFIINVILAPERLRRRIITVAHLHVKIRSKDIFPNPRKLNNVRFFSLKMFGAKMVASMILGLNTKKKSI